MIFVINLSENEFWKNHFGKIILEKSFWKNHIILNHIKYAYKYFNFCLII
jgi:hypothetical protein